MSSSQRKSRAKATKRGWQCVTCGEHGVKALVGDVVVRRHRFRAVAHERCSKCGERYYGLEACRRFDDYFLGRKRSAA